MTDKEYIGGLVEKARTAVAQIENYNQKQTDAMVRAAGKVIFDNSELFAKQSIKETGKGDIASKVSRHQSLGILWNYLKDKPSVGVIDYDPVNKITTIAKPMGVICAVTPSTGPSTNPAFNIMIGLKGRNAVIIAPHPGAKETAVLIVKLVTEELEKLGAPRDLVQCIEEPSVELTQLLMASADVITATGGYNMVKAAYSSGKPSLGVGQGNVQVLLDEEYDEIPKMVPYIVFDRAADNGIPCTGEQTIFIPRKRKDEVLAEFVKHGCYVLEDRDAIDNKIRPNAFDEKKVINRALIGKRPVDAFRILGVEVPETCKLVLLELEKCGTDEILAKEMMFPVLRFYLYDDFEDACEKAKKNLMQEGAGHSAIIWSKNKEKILYAANKLPVGRLLVEQYGGASAGNNYTNGLAPTASVGCGTWGNNTVSENITYRHLLNVTKVSEAIDNPPEYTYEETWGVD